MRRQRKRDAKRKRRDELRRQIREDNRWAKLYEGEGRQQRWHELPGLEKLLEDASEKPNVRD